MIPIRIGTQRRAAVSLSSTSLIFALMNDRNSAAITPPSTGEITQLAAICPIVGQFTAATPAAAIPAPITPPTMECVVDTGAPSQVARFSQSDAAISADIIAQMKICGSAIASGDTMPPEMVLTTSPPAISAPAVSKTAAIIKRPTHGQGISPDCRAHVVGHIIGADVQRHIGAESGGNNHDQRIWCIADKKGGDQAWSPQ